MMTVLAIMSVMAALTLPSLRHVSQTTHATVLQSQLLHVLRFAKNAAREKQLPIAVCKTKSLQSCDGDWSDGLLVFIDRDENGTLKSKNDILQVTQLLAAKGKLYWRSFPFARSYLRFTPKRYLTADNGMFWYCGQERLAPDFAIVVSYTGMLRLVLPDAKGFIRNRRGKELSCLPSNL